MRVDFEVIDGIIVVILKGHLSYESASAFRANCLSQLRSEKIVFNLSELSFVGSNGIKSFLDTMAELSVDQTFDVKFCGVGIEFYRLFQMSPLKDAEIYEDDKIARVSFHTPQNQCKPVIRASDVPQDFEEEGRVRRNR